MVEILSLVMWELVTARNGFILYRHHSAPWCEAISVAVQVLISFSVRVCYPQAWNHLKTHSRVCEDIFPQQESAYMLCEAWYTRKTHFIPHENPQALTCFRVFQKFTLSQELRGMFARTVSWPQLLLSELHLPDRRTSGKSKVNAI